jgi:hypothetical protein
MTSFDHFGVANLFYGPQVGVSCDLRWGRWSFDATGKVAAGVVHQTAKVQGGTTLRLDDGGTVGYDGGVFAQPGVGPVSEDHFAVIPEITLAAGCRVTSWLRLTAGYDVLCISRVTRAASLVGGADSRQVFQLDSYDPTVHPAGPAARLPGSTLWVQGLTCGIELAY